MEEKEINPSESFAIISTMIAHTKNKLADDSTMIIFWGWLVFAAVIINYTGVVLQKDEAYFVWPVLMPIGLIFSIIYRRKEMKKKKVKTYVESYLGYSQIAFIIALFISLVFMWTHGVKTTYFFIMLLYGVATLITGGILNFRPLVLGSIFSFVAAVISVFAGYNEQFLCLAGALLFSYIIPGHLLRLQYKSQVNAQTS